MNHYRPSRYLYVLLAVFFGLIVGVYLRDDDVTVVLGVIALIGIAAIIWYMKASDDQDGTNMDKKDSSSLDAQKNEPVEVLSKEAARQWLDDFLVEHQKNKREE